MTKRDIYLRALRKPGATLATVAAEFGVSRQAISQARNADRAAQARRRSDDRRQRASGRPSPHCDVCGGRGHASHCKGKGDRCSGCGAMNPRKLWVEGACPRCGRVRGSRKLARQ